MSAIKPTACGHCDFSSGMRGMDRCSKCDGHGSVFRVGNQIFENTRDGYVAALEAKVATLSTKLAEAERERDEALEEAQSPIWPEWAAGIAKCLRGYGVDPSDDEWDLPQDFEDWIAGVVENETRRANTAEARVAELEKALSEIATKNQERHWSAYQWVTTDGQYAKIARAALAATKEPKP